MNFFSFNWLLFLSLLVIIFYVSKSKTYRRFVLSVANLVFLLTFMANEKSCISLGLFVVISFAILYMGRAWRWGGWISLGIGFALISLIYVKQYDFLCLFLPGELLNHPFEFIGISYMTFKFIHMVVDLHQRQLATFNFLSYANYQLGFFSLVAGPIQRYNNFHEFWDKIGAGFPTQREGLRALSRIISGMIKIGIIAEIAIYLYERATGIFFQPGPNAIQAELLRFTVMFYAYPIYIYFNFSGYCDIVIGAANILGMKHQENFNRPYLARNLIDFWNRWHISLTKWIRDYVFMTSYKWVAERWITHANKIGYFLLFLALFLAGIWHGSTWNFFVFGLIHGIGIAATQIYGDILKFILGRSGYKRYVMNPWIRMLSICATFHYICFCFLFFRSDLHWTIDMLTKVISDFLEGVRIYV